MRLHAAGVHWCVQDFHAEASELGMQRRRLTLGHAHVLLVGNLIAGNVARAIATAFRMMPLVMQRQFMGSRREENGVKHPWALEMT